MLTVDDYAKIRLRPSRRHEHSRDRPHLPSLAPQGPRRSSPSPSPSPTPAAKPPPAPVLGSFHAVIDAILAADEDAPPKQRHTAMQVFRRLRDEHGYTRRLRPGPPLRRQAPPRPPRDLHPAGPRPRPAAGGRLRPHPRRFPRRPPPGAGADRRLGLLQLRLRPGPAHRAHRGHPGRHGRGLRLLRLRAARGLVGQPDHGGRPDLQGPRAPAQRLLRGPGQPLHLRAAVLHAGPGQREAARRDARPRPAAAVGHAGAPGRRPGRA